MPTAAPTPSPIPPSGIALETPHSRFAQPTAAPLKPSLGRRSVIIGKWDVSRHPDIYSGNIHLRPPELFPLADLSRVVVLNFFQRHYSERG
jgi:hypothetical protein